MLLALLLALAATASPSPSPSPTPSPAATPSGPALKEIGSVRSTLYCSSFYGHFNAAVRPMLQNDLTLDKVSTSLDRINHLFSEINREQRFWEERLALESYVRALMDNNFLIQREVNALREGQTYTVDPEKSKEMHMLAQELQRALDKQKQMQVDLLGVVHVMMDFEFSSKPHARQDMANALNDLQNPKDLNDIKAVLRFNGMRDRLHDAEVMSAEHAQTILEKYC